MSITLSQLIGGVMLKAAIIFAVLAIRSGRKSRQQQEQEDVARINRVVDEYYRLHPNG